LILDRTLTLAALREALFGGLYWWQTLSTLLGYAFTKRGRTLDQLASRLNVPAPALKAAVEANNAAVARTAPDPIGKSDGMRAAISKAPYFALDIGATAYPFPAFTLGGLHIDERTGAVLTEDGPAVQGLYAAGRCTVSFCGNGYVSGLSISDCLWSGRRVGLAPVPVDQAVPEVAS
jgi:3-oxo-5alpha-steroid 4-dehydrogenase